MGKKISDLTQILNPTGNELIPVAIDGMNKSIKVSALKGADNLTDKYVEVIGDDNKSYRVMVKNGQVVAIPSEVFTATPVVDGDNARFDGLVINQMYGGGNAIEETPVSHSFIELYNYREEEINLKGLYLFYKAKAGSWQSLALEGIVKPKHSFLIRCAQHNDPYAICVRCPILNYDMSWDIKLSDQGFSCYLCIGNVVPTGNPIRKTIAADGTVSWTNGSYIDLLGAGGKDSSQTVEAFETRYLHCMDRNTAIHRVDFANAGSKNIGSNLLCKGTNDSDCEPIDYKTCNVSIYRPRWSGDGRWTEFYDKPKQKETVPSMINIMYGVDGEHTRTFTFQTPLTDNGFVKIRKENEPKWRSYPTTLEMCSNVDGDTNVHRCIIHDLQPGNYEYQVGTEGCTSDTYTFEVKEYSNSDSIRVFFDTDHQGWTIREYSVVKAAYDYLNTKADLFDFHLNCGDVSQNASRRFEWGMQSEYAGAFNKNMCHALSCGNNDLIDKKYSDAFNYYTTNENKFANSCYYFDLGYVHWVCLNSNTDSTYVDGVGSVGGYVDTNAFLEAQAQWLDQHLTQVNQRAVKPRWIIVYAHLSPFTVTRAKRLQRWIAPIEKHKVDLFLCGK